MAVGRTAGEHPNAGLARRAQQAFMARDMRTLGEVFDQDRLEWTVYGHGPASGTTVGIENVFRNFQDIVSWTAGTYRVTPVDYLGSDDHAVVLARVTARRGDGMRLDVPETVIFTVRAGRLAQAHHLAYDELAWDSFFDGMPTWR